MMRRAFCVLALAGASSVYAAGKPNIVVLLADDLGWTDLHAGGPSLGNGSRYHQTPHIDRLATEGMSFTSTYACPNCAPTRAALMTGQYPVRNGVYNVGDLARGKGNLIPPEQREHILAEAVTLAETLKSAGYATAHVGKYHVSAHPDVTKNDGFDVNYGGGWKGDGGPKSYFAVKASGGSGWTFANLGPEMNPFAVPYTKEYVERNLAPYASGNDPATLADTPKHLTDAMADAAVEYISSHAGKDKPFFINVAFNAVHTGIRPRADLLAKWEKIKSTDPRHKRADYAALLEGLDHSVARIMKSLEDPNGDGNTADSIAENTLVLFLSDNGGFVGATSNVPLRGHKGTFYEGGIRVPLIARWPGHVKAGAGSSTLINVVDLYPTLADVAAAQIPTPSTHALDGESFSTVLMGSAADRARSPVFYHFPGYLDTRAYPCSVIVKDVDNARYKLIYSYEDRHYELYNLGADLSEKNDLLAEGKASEESTRIASDLRSDLTQWLSTGEPLFAADKDTMKAVPMPIDVRAALAAGNKITRQMIATKGAQE